MPRIKDVVLASVMEKSDSNEDTQVIHSDITTHRDMLDITESLAPPELIAEFEEAFNSYFGAVMVDNREISSSSFFNMEYKKKMSNYFNEKIQIFEEPNYCKK